MKHAGVRLAGWVQGVVGRCVVGEEAEVGLGSVRVVDVEEGVDALEESRFFYGGGVLGQACPSEDGRPRVVALV